jgi:transmembrane sensor
MTATQLNAAPDGRHRAEEEAAQWYALLRSGEATAVDRARWQAWLDAGDMHRKAWNLVERVSRRFEPIQTSPDPRSTAAVLQNAQSRPMSRRLLLGMAGAGATGVLAWAVWQQTPVSQMAMAWAADHRTAMGETRKLVLEDGTQLWLGSASAVNTSYGTGLRRLQLVAGEVLVETAADASRPFVVDTSQGRLRALGTRFNVRLEEGRTLLAVFEGAVEVRPASTDAGTVVRAGQQTRFSADAIESIAAADPGREAWTQGILLAQDMTLHDVAAELARYRAGYLRVAPEVAGLRVFGSFPLHDTDTALAMLSTVLPVQARQSLPWWTTIEARSGTPPPGR